MHSEAASRLLFALIATTTLMAYFGPAFAYADSVPVNDNPPIIRELVEKKAPIYDYSSCVAGVRVYIPSLPHMNASDFAGLPHSTPAPGRVAIFHYENNVWHVAYVLSVSEEGFTVFEYNFHKNKKDTRFVSWSDDSIYGFWDADGG